jgi:actin-like ATPase involved in cell morphogenesis
VSEPAGSDDPLREVQDVLTDIVAAPLAEIVAELNKTLAYPELHRSRLVPQMLWLFGGGATVRNIAEHLSSKTGLPARVWGLAARGDAQLVTAAPALFGPAAALSALAWES